MPLLLKPSPRGVSATCFMHFFPNQHPFKEVVCEVALRHAYTSTPAGGGVFGLRKDVSLVLQSVSLSAYVFIPCCLASIHAQSQSGAAKNSVWDIFSVLPSPNEPHPKPSQSPTKARSRLDSFESQPSQCIGEKVRIIAINIKLQ